MSEINIAVPAHVIYEQNYLGEFGYPRQVLNLDYSRSLEEAGACCYIFGESRDEEKLAAKLAKMDAILFTGGNDIQTFYYKQEPTHCTETAPGRDNFEFKMMEIAVERKMPMMGICRGLQLMNVFFGGSLYQDIYKEKAAEIKHVQEGNIRLGWHSIDILEGSHLHKALGVSNTRINSLHHQAINELAPGFTVSAKAKDGIIEAIEADGEQFCLGVQWHPELLSLNNEQQAGLFRYFVEKVKEQKAAQA